MIEEQAALNIKSVVRYLRQTTNNTVLVQDDGYYAPYVVPMADTRTGTTRQMNVLLDFSKLHFGGTRYWLVCEHCRRRFTNLYWKSDKLACRLCLGLDYGSRIYVSNPLCMAYIRRKKAAELLDNRRLVYAGKPTRAGRRLNRLISPGEFAEMVEDVFNRY